MTLHSFLRNWLVYWVSLGWTPLVWSQAPAEPAAPPPSLAAAAPTAPNPVALQFQRSAYLAAETALRQGKLTTFRKHLEVLESYPLKPYLEYGELRRRLHRFPYEDVDAFLAQNAHTYLGDLLLSRWLHTLAKHEHWRDYQRYFPAEERDAELRCLYLWARHRSDDATAMDDVAPLWNVGESQAEACDPLFDAWMEAGRLTPEIAWERFRKAMDNREYDLARYVAKKMPAAMKALADLYLEVDRHPERLKQRERFAEQSPAMHEIILHGIRRYARRHPLEAAQVWERYDAQHFFPTEGRNDTQEYLIICLAKAGHMELAETLLRQAKKITNGELIEWLARDALRQQDWQRVYDAIQWLPPETQQTERWLYWRARALDNLGIDDPAYPTPQQLYSSLALTRTFYGFLAADIVGRDYTLVDRPVDTPTEMVERIAALPAVARTKELLELGEINNARREWWYATRKLDPTGLLAAGKLAEQWGWYRKSIQAMIEARYWDDLELRFPLAYRELFTSAAQSINVDPPWLFAIARQESAFAADARSSAGAMGLMQLMPATARQTARKLGMKHQYWDLVDPNHNIQLGSRYLHQLLNEFGGNRVLATAAYNAGPHRVKTWLDASQDQPLPNDIWIETIPFAETRGYVQNVLSFSVIYSYRLGSQFSLLTESDVIRSLAPVASN